MTGRIPSLLSRRMGSTGPGPGHGDSSPTEPCAICGDETAIGSIFYSDRHAITHPDGRRTYLCTLCDERIRSSRHGPRLTDDAVRDLDAIAILSVYMTLGPMGHYGF